MDDDGLRNWVYYEPTTTTTRGLGLQLMPAMTDRDTKPFLSGRESSVMAAGNGVFHPRDYAASGVPDHMDYVRETWINHRDRFLQMFPGNHYNSVLAETSGSHQMQMVQQQPDTTTDTRVAVEDPSVRKEAGPAKKRAAAAAGPKPPKAKKSKKSAAVPKENGSSSVQRTKAAKKNMDVVINGIDLDISGIPIPVCSCTGTPQQCYRWGCGGWQSACCTTTISMYPLPMSTKRRGARIAGRKMSQGAFKKVLEKLAAEGYNFANPIDLRTHWAKHGTNKFVTIRRIHRDQSSIKKEIVNLQKMQGLIDLLLQIKPLSSAADVFLIVEAMDGIVMESFDIYSRMCKMIANVVSKIQTVAKSEATMILRILEKAVVQGNELTMYFELCREIGVERALEIPNPPRIPDEDIELLKKMVNNNEVPSEMPLPLLKMEEEEEGKKAAPSKVRKENQKKISAIVVRTNKVDKKEDLRNDPRSEFRTIITNNWEKFDEDFKIVTAEESPSSSSAIVVSQEQSSFFTLSEFHHGKKYQELPDLITFS